MTAPVPAAIEVTSDASRSGTTFALNIPAPVDSSDGSGDFLIAFLTHEDGGLSISPGGGWSVLYSEPTSNPIVTGHCIYKMADGTEGATENIAVSDDTCEAICIRYTGAADSSVKPPEYTMTVTGANPTTSVAPPIMPSAKKPDDYGWIAAFHTSKAINPTSQPEPNNFTNQFGADCAISIATDNGSADYSTDGGRWVRLVGGETWYALNVRVAIYPAVPYVEPADNFAKIKTVAETDDSSRTGSTLALNLPAGIAAGDVVLAVITQEFITQSSSEGGIVWPSGWVELYNRRHVLNGLHGSAAWFVGTGAEGATVDVDVYGLGEISAFAWRFDSAEPIRIDYRLNEDIEDGVSDDVSFKELTPLGGADNFLWLAVAHLDANSGLFSYGTTASYKSHGRKSSSAGAVSTRFSHRALNAASETPPTHDTSPDGDYLSAVFAIYSNTQVADTVRTTQAAAQFAFTPTNVDARVTQAAAQYLFQQLNFARLTQVAAQVLVAAIPCVRQRCQVWKITRRDGIEYCYTTHDEPVAFHGKTYLPCNSLRASAAEAGTLNAVGGGDIEIRGLISADEITERDMANGLFDGADVEVWETSWGDQKLASDSPKRLLKGVIGETTQGATYYQAEVFNRSAKLAQNPLLDTYTPACRFKPGDGRCPINPELHINRGEVTGKVVIIARDRRRYRQFFATGPGEYGSSSSSSGEVAIPWEHGLITWLTGLNAGIESEIKSLESQVGGLVVTLWDALPHEIEPGDTFEVRPGCARTKEAHVTTWGLDIESFGGFPDIPGVDSLIRGPRT